MGPRRRLRAYPRLAPGKLRRKEKVRSRNKKRTFKAEELRAFFQYPVWTGAHSDRKYYVAGPHIIKNGTFWVPLLCAYTGLRREEAAGLGPDDLSEIRTDNGHKFQAKFHWHVEDLGIRHAYIKRGTPQLNGKVERSHRSDGQEFYQLLSYKGDVDLEAKLDDWERFYNFHRPHGAHNGKTPYEALRERL